MERMSFASSRERTSERIQRIEAANHFSQSERVERALQSTRVEAAAPGQRIERVTSSATAHTFSHARQNLVSAPGAANAPLHLPAGSKLSVDTFRAYRAAVSSPPAAVVASTPNNQDKNVLVAVLPKRLELRGDLRMTGSNGQVLGRAAIEGEVR
jgi:hypothetical protein